MWDLFGVTEENVSVEHIVDPTRRLWFFSNFPHLIKCLRNFFSKLNKYDQVWVVVVGRNAGVPREALMSPRSLDPL